MRLKLMGLFLVVATAPAWAESPAGVAADVSTFADSKAQIEDDLRKGERYSELTRHQREDVVAALERMERLLEGITAVSELRPQDRAALLNDQELVNTILTAAEEDSRLICKRVVRTGSHRPSTQCRTVGERRRERENSQEGMRRVQKSHLSPRGG